MEKGVCVFDLDNTLGDFTSIMSYGLLFEPSVISNYYNMTQDKRDEYNAHINYDTETIELLQSLRDKFEDELDKKGINNNIFRPNLIDILTPLTDEVDKRISGFVIYSNNSDPYSLQYAKRYIEKTFHKTLFLDLLDRNHPSRIHDNRPSNGNRSKLISTVKDVLHLDNLQDKNILFMDDMDVHTDFLKANYIQVEPYFNTHTINNWNIFENIIKEFDIEKIFNLYHVKNVLKINTISEFKKLIYTPNEKSDSFENDAESIKNKVHLYIDNLPKIGGKKRYARRKRKTVKKKRLSKF